MAFRLALAILVLALAAMAASAYPSGNFTFEPAQLMEPEGHGVVVDALDFDDEMMMESESARRQLAAGKRRRYISYAALARNNVPCNQRGKSYYNCVGHQRANPYTRGCTRATHCARNTR